MDTPNKIAHQLNNMLANIGLSTELLLNGVCGPINKEQKKYLASILAEAKKMKSLVKKLGNN